MGEWSYQHYERPCDIVDIATMQPVMSVDANEADIAIEAHNADIAAYEVRIAALAAELARVKAESLRVVKVGEPCALGECRESHFFTGVSDILACADEYVIGMYGDQIVQPVRLERWEDEG